MRDLEKTRHTKKMKMVPVRIGSTEFEIKKQDEALAVQIVRRLITANDNDGESVPASVAFPELGKKRSRGASVLRGMRGKEGLTQAELADQLGIPQGNVAAMESGKRPIGKAMAKRLADILDTDYRVFL